MTDRAKKVSELTALANAAGEDLLLIIDDPSGTPESKKITVANFFGNVATNTLIRNTLTVNGAVLLAGNTSISKTLTVSNNVNITGNIGISGSISVANAAVINSTGFWVGNPSGLKGDKGVTGDKGDKGNTGDKGDKGNTGDTGDKGVLDLNTDFLRSGYYTLTIEAGDKVQRYAVIKSGEHEQGWKDRKSTRLNSSHSAKSRMPSSA